ncbi:hypothetical protein C2869_08070 [Saccharobesus litoralis]|uniref:DUF3019 domain-containing protein n=1 Tax=Saccharobesus litoralis TaxID=2172099 RepID=A0A2S0VQ95_9ALTE|nr:DUF3019 domain-containing protein [Saccharobesus litoralis]AWB66386.1 hypothetical protein C2869_08070 [Saccharobesus litoralis]
MKRLFEWNRKGLSFGHLLLAGMLGLIGLSVAMAEQKDYLAVEPQRCIALKEGQMCYQTVMFAWQAKQADDYCLVSLTKRRALYCWEAASQGKLEFEVQGKVNQEFALVDGDGRYISQTQVEVAWVYGNRKHRQSSWRLF